MAKDETTENPSKLNDKKDLKTAGPLVHKNWTELIKPKTIDVLDDGESKNKGSVVIEPLERGFGLTLGGILLSVISWPTGKEIRETFNGQVPNEILADLAFWYILNCFQGRFVKFQYVFQERF